MSLFVLIDSLDYLVATIRCFPVHPFKLFPVPVIFTLPLDVAHREQSCVRSVKQSAQILSGYIVKQLAVCKYGKFPNTYLSSGLTVPETRRFFKPVRLPIPTSRLKPTNTVSKSRCFYLLRTLHFINQINIIRYFKHAHETEMLTCHVSCMHILVR